MLRKSVKVNLRLLWSCLCELCVCTSGESLSPSWATRTGLRKGTMIRCTLQAHLCTVRLQYVVISYFFCFFWDTDVVTLINWAHLSRKDDLFGLASVSAFAPSPASASASACST